MKKAARATWWVGTPIVFLIWLVTPRESVIYVSHEPFSIESNTFQTSLHPIAGELVAYYRITAAAIALAIIVTLISHVRRTRAVHSLTLLLPVYVAAIETCTHFRWFGRRHSFTSLPTQDELREQLWNAATASLVAIVTALVIAAALRRWAREGVAEGASWWTVLPALAPLGSALAIWGAADRIFFG